MPTTRTTTRTRTRTRTRTKQSLEPVELRSRLKIVGVQSLTSAVWGMFERKK
jgi:hypothetical protein